MIGTLQACEAVKFLFRVGELLADRMLIYDALENGFSKVAIRRNPRCPVCGAEPTITGLRDEADVVNACGLGTR